MPVNFKKTILLTGAGFTANFGGVLAREMWSKILNNKKIDDLPEAKKLLMENFDFEAVASEFLNKHTTTADQKVLFQKIISESYESMDRTIKHFCTHGFNDYGVSWSNVARFLALFNGAGSQKGVHFTLNQDLLLERAIQAHGLGLTAVTHRDYWYSIFQNQLDANVPVQLPDEAGVQDYITNRLPTEGSSYYVKLHGSQGWVSYAGGNQMVIGKNKANDIQSEPLLKWYSSLFEEALYREDVSLFVIGYSFRDEHINDILIKAIEEFGLKLFVISPEDPERLRDRLEGKDTVPAGASYERQVRRLKIWDAIRGYFPYTLGDIFPTGNDDGTETYKDIKKNIEE